MTSRMSPTPRSACKNRSNPSPNPPCGTVPNRRRSRYLHTHTPRDHDEMCNTHHLPLVVLKHAQSMKIDREKNGSAIHHEMFLTW